jgi:transcriptional regulator with XRE-family HTH domain
MASTRKSSGRMASKGLPNPIDVHVGARIRLRRSLLGMTQGTVAARLGITFQQLQKYERGLNRVSSSRLYDLCRVLDVQVVYFFDGIDGKVANQSPAKLQGKAPPRIAVEKDPATRRETLEFVRAYYAITDLRVRVKLGAFIRAVADGAVLRTKGA